MINTIFAISRQYGSAGHEIGQKLAQELDIPFYDKELIAIAAKESGVSEKLFESADEKASSSLIYSLMMGSYTFGTRDDLNGDMPINDKLFLIQSEIMDKAAQQGPCVIVGRCADYVLRKYSRLFSVFIHADRFSRMDRVVKQYGIEPEIAAEYLVKKDKQRANYYNFYTNQKWDDFDNYDLTVDSSSIGIEHAVKLIETAAEMKERSRIR